MDRMKRLIEAIRILIEGEFSGYIKINFSQGSLGRIEKSEEFEDATIILTGEKNSRKRSEEKDFHHGRVPVLPAGNDHDTPYTDV